MKTVRMLFLLLAAACAYAADGGTDIIDQQGLVRVGGAYQSWTLSDSTNHHEISVPVEVYYPVNRQVSLSLFLAQASARVKEGTTLGVGGMTDALLGVNYYIEDKNLLLSLGCNIPTGKRELELEEFAASVAMSQSFFNYQVPVFGQGLNLSPGFTWAKPLDEKTVLGLGASFQLKGGYLPIKEMSADSAYNPGDEILLTGGLDYQVSELAAMSMDLTFTMFGKDKIGDDEVFKSGTKVMAAVQYKQYMNYDLVRVFARFRSRAKSEIFFREPSVKAKMQPDELEFMASYRKRLNPRTYVSYSAEARFFLKDDEMDFDGLTQFGPGLSASTRISPTTALQGRIKYLYAKYKGAEDSMSGLEIGGGFEYTF